MELKAMQSGKPVATLKDRAKKPVVPTNVFFNKTSAIGDGIRVRYLPGEALFSLRLKPKAAGRESQVCQCSIGLAGPYELARDVVSAVAESFAAGKVEKAGLFELRDRLLEEYKSKSSAVTSSCSASATSSSTSSRSARASATSSSTSSGSASASAVELDDDEHCGDYTATELELEEDEEEEDRESDDEVDDSE
jgi:hypothetical protein